jgi:hypothetical protein
MIQFYSLSSTIFFSAFITNHHKNHFKISYSDCQNEETDQGSLHGALLSMLPHRTRESVLPLRRESVAATAPGECSHRRRAGRPCRHRAERPCRRLLRGEFRRCRRESVSPAMLGEHLAAAAA